MKKHERARILAIVVSTYLYSTTPIPNKLGAMNIRFTDWGKLPTGAEITWLLSYIEPQAYPELFGNKNPA